MVLQLFMLSNIALFVILWNMFPPLKHMESLAILAARQLPEISIWDAQASSVASAGQGSCSLPLHSSRFFPLR